MFFVKYIGKYCTEVQQMSEINHLNRFSVCFICAVVTGDLGTGRQEGLQRFC